MANYYTQSLPVVGVTAGPTWASFLNTVLNLVENHAHTGDDEQRIKTAAISLNADLSFNGFAPYNMKSARFLNQALPAVGSNSYGFLVDASGNLYFENASTQVPIVSGGAIVQTGTGAFNGFYNGGGNGYAGSPPGTGGAGAYYDQTLLEYRFNTTTTSPSNSNLANVGVAGLDIRNPSLSAPALYSRNTSKTGGFALSPQSSGFTVLFDSLAAGTYGVSGLAVTPLGFNNSYGLGVNLGTITPVVALDVQVTSSSTTAFEMQRLGLRSVASPGTGFGPQLSFRAASTSGSSATLVNQGAIRGFWNTVGTFAGVQLLTANSGTFSSTAALEAVSFTSALSLGLAGAAVAPAGAVSLVTTYADLRPAANNTYGLGTAGLRFAGMFGTTLDVSSNAAVGGTLAVTGATTVATLTVNGPTQFNQNISVQNILSNGSSVLGAPGTQFANAYVAGAKIGRGNVVWHACYVNSSGTVVTQDNNNVSVSCSRTAQGLYTLTYTGSVSGMIVAVSATDTTFPTVATGYISGTNTVNVGTTDVAAAAQNRGFTVLLINP